MLTHAEAQNRQERIAACIEETDGLANVILFEGAEYRKFEEILIKLRADGMFPTNELVGDVADAVA